MAAFDFRWDDDGTLGVYVEHKDHPTGICVEAQVRTAPDNSVEWGEPTGEYKLASQIVLDSWDRVVTHAGRTLYGAEARAFLSNLARIEAEGRQVPVNARQARQQEAVVKAAGEFPKEFGLLGFPGRVFSISRGASCFSDQEGVLLYTYILEDGGQWSAFVKCPTSELHSQMVPL